MLSIEKSKMLHQSKATVLALPDGIIIAIPFRIPIMPVAIDDVIALDAGVLHTVEHIFKGLLILSHGKMHTNKDWGSKITLVIVITLLLSLRLRDEMITLLHYMLVV